jgi:CBS domain containing-hemolysin-like protein
MPQEWGGGIVAAWLSEGVSMADAALHTRTFSDRVPLELPCHARSSGVRLDSPAVDVMTPLAGLAAATVMPHEGLEQAEERIAQQGVPFLLVVARMPRVLGIVDLHDLRGDKPLRLGSQRRLAYRDLRVCDLMQPVSQLDAIELPALRRASVAQVVATLVRSGRSHLLVVEAAPDTGVVHMLGLLSKIQLERQLGTQLPASAIAGTFAEIGQALI